MSSQLVHLIGLLLTISWLSGFSGAVSTLGFSKLSVPSPNEKALYGGVNGPGRRSLLSHTEELETALVASLDGTIYLTEPISRKVLWAFASGSTIYSSYHAPLSHDDDKENASGPGLSYFMDCGDDWNLYVHSKFGKVKIQTSIDEFIKITPHITEDGQVLLGFKETTVFMVDARTGRLISTYRLSDSSPTSQSNEEKNIVYGTPIEESRQPASMHIKTDDLPLYITRTDYTLKHLDRDSTVLWNVTVSDIGAAFLCDDIENSLGEALSDSGYELPSEPGLRFKMPIPCQKKAVVYRFRSPRMLEDFYRANMLPQTRHEDGDLSLSTSTHMLPSQPEVDQSFEFYHNDKILSEPVPDLFLPLQPHDDKHLDFKHKRNTVPVVSLQSLTEYLGFSGLHDMKVPLHYILSILPRDLFILSIIILLGFPILIITLVVIARKPGKDSGVTEKINTNTSADDRPTGRTIGKLFISNTEIAKGSNGTIILEGIYEGRTVAVKRLVKTHHDVAVKEIRNLIASDQHRNIVRWYGVEFDQDFVYLALERCTCSLYDLIQMLSDSCGGPLYKDQTMKAMAKDEVRLESKKGILQDVKLWKPNGYPSPILLKLMRDMVSGLVHLHEVGIVHRDLKPQNVLITKEKSLWAKLSDMGISKCLSENMSSLTYNNTGSGSSGWQAPEQLLQGRQTRSVDIFSLGCVLFYCISGGQHPYGNHLERDINITKNQVDLFPVEHIPEAVDLFSHLLDPNPELRPKALEVFHHPFFWNAEKRLSFLRDCSDRVELEDRGANSDILKALENVAPTALGGKWNKKLEPAFINNIGHYRRYKFDSVRDLLRVVRNKLNHYRELPLEIQGILGSVPEGFDSYFASRFPKFLIEVYKVMHNFCREEEDFLKYFKGNVV